jgi:hypothetical protein
LQKMKKHVHALNVAHFILAKVQLRKVGLFYRKQQMLIIQTT